MKTLGLFLGISARSFSRWLVLPVITGAAFSVAPVARGASPGVSLEAPNLHEAQVEGHLIRVHYPRGVAVESLDDNDLWVVSRNGYNALAKFVEVHEWEFPADGQDPAGLVAPGGPGFPDFWPGLIATYSVLPPRVEGWMVEDNASYSVLLQPGEVSMQNGWAYPADLLGSFRVRIGEPVPDLPVRTAIEVVREGDSVFAVVTLYWQTTGHEVDWGEVELRGQSLSVDLVITGAGEADAPETQEFRYDLSGTPSGAYRFAVTSDGQVLAWREIRIHESEPIPADADLAVRIDGDGTAILHAVVRLHDPYFVVSDPGNPVLEGNVFRISATAERVVFVQEPEAPGIFETDYRLGQLEAGAYRVLFELNGSLIGDTAFRFGPDDPGPLRAAAELNLVREGDRVWADVTVKLADASYEVADWGVPRLEGHTIYLDSEAGLRDATNPDGTIGQDAEVGDGNIFRRRYAVWPLEESGGGGGGTEVRFTPVEPDPFLLFDGPQNVVLRSREEWAAWIERHRDPFIRAAIIEPPVDWDSEMLIGVFLGPVPLGQWVQIEGVQETADGYRVDYRRFIGGAPPPEDEIVYPGAMAVVPASALPVEFVESTIALPGPPPPLPDSPMEPEPAAQGDEPDDGNASERIVQVVFRINGHPYARGSFSPSGAVEPEEPPHTSAELQLGEEDGAIVADVVVRVFRYPYLQVVDWGEPRREGSHIVFEAATAQVEYLVEPELPLEERHRYSIEGLEPGLYHFLFRLDGRDAARAFQIVGREDGIPGHPFEDWLKEVLAGWQGAEVGLPPLGDLDGDGNSDFAEFALGSNPLRGGEGPMVRPEWMRDDAGLHLGLRFHRRDAASGIRYVVEGSPDMVHWENLEGLVDEAEVLPLEGGLEEVLLSLREVIAESPHRYLRLRLSQLTD